MIAEIFPEGFQRYQALPVLGPLMGRYADWLREQQYTWRSTRYELLRAGRAAEYLQRRSVRRIEELTQPHLDACHRLFSKKFPAEAGAILVLTRFLHEMPDTYSPGNADHWPRHHKPAPCLLVR
jgi:hypothetical protein